MEDNRFLLYENLNFVPGQTFFLKDYFFLNHIFGVVSFSLILSHMYCVNYFGLFNLCQVFSFISRTFSITFRLNYL